MEEQTTTPSAPPIDDVKPPLPDASSTGAEFSEDYGPEPFPSKDTIQAMQHPSETEQPSNDANAPVASDEQPLSPPAEEKPDADQAPEAVAPDEAPTQTPEVAVPPNETTQPAPKEEIKEEVDADQSMPSSEEVPVPAKAESPQPEIKDHGTHRSAPRSGSKSTAFIVGFVGIALAAIVIFVYISTN